jgi:hypothetical protein
MEQLQEQDPNLKDSMPNMGLEMMFHPFNLFLMAITFFASIALLVGSIGVLRRRRSGASILRGTCCGMAVLTLVQSAFGTWMQLTNKDQVLKSTEAQFNRTQGGDLPPGIETMMEAGFYLGVGFSIFLAVLFVGFYVWAFIHFGRASTLAQFPDPSTAPAY